MPNIDQIQESWLKTSEELSKASLESQLISFNYIYLDLRYLKDFELGTLLMASQNDPEAYKYIVERLPLYDCRAVEMDIFTAFSDLEKDYRPIYDRLIKDTSIHGNLWAMAPFTFVLLILDVVFSTSIRSKMIQQERYEPTIIINFYPYHFSTKFLKLIRAQLQHLCQARFNLKMTIFPYSKIDREIFDKTDLIFTVDPVSFFAEDSPIYDSMFNLRQYMAKRIIAPKKFDPKIVFKDKNPDYRLMTLDTLQALNLFCEYYYLEPYILTDEDEKIKYEGVVLDSKSDNFFKSIFSHVKVKEANEANLKV